MRLGEAVAARERVEDLLEYGDEARPLVALGLFEARAAAVEDQRGKRLVLLTEEGDDGLTGPRKLHPLHLQTARTLPERREHPLEDAAVAAIEQPPRIRGIRERRCEEDEPVTHDRIASSGRGGRMPVAVPKSWSLWGYPPPDIAHVGQPSPRVAIATLSLLTGWQPEPILFAAKADP